MIIKKQALYSELPRLMPYKAFKPYAKRILLFLLALSVLSTSACQAKFNTSLKDPVTVTDYKLNTYVSISAYETASLSTKDLKSLLKESLDLCDYYDLLFSRTNEDSALYKLNHNETSIVPKETGELIKTGLEYSKISKGTFDISIGSVSSLWDFNTDKPKIPSDSDIHDALKYVNYENISLEENSDSTYTVIKPEKTMLDLGAVAKGYIADHIKTFLKEKGLNRAIINLGGNVLCVGNKAGNVDFNIGVRKPFADDTSTLMSLKVNDSSVVSSGNYERYFKVDDKIYHHILNPKTGYPYDNNISEVTITSDDSLTGDCLSTSVFTLGIEDGLALINSIDKVEAFIYTNDGQFYYSNGFKH